MIELAEVLSVDIEYLIVKVALFIVRASKSNISGPCSSSEVVRCFLYFGLSKMNIGRGERLKKLTAKCSINDLLYSLVENHWNI